MKEKRSNHKLAAAAAILAMFSISVCGLAEAAGAGGIRLGDDVVPAPDGYEPVSAKYVAAVPTDVYISWFIWAGKVKGVHFNAGQPVEILAKPKGYDWLLVGKGGTAIGYVPTANVAPAKQ